jgi:arylsulfatase A-like enzyme
MDSIHHSLLLRGTSASLLLSNTGSPFAGRCFIVHVLLLLIAWHGLLISASGNQSSAPAAPNIILIIADDMEWDDAGCYGHPVVRTPNLDRLAAQGMRFTHGFMTASSCSPSRASLITGLYPHNTGAEELHWPVPAGQVTFVEKLRQQGYWTAAAGKWHLGDAMRSRFDLVREVDTSGFQLPSGSKGLEGKFAQTYEGDARSGCADWLSVLNARPTDRPFFLWLASLDPHRPYDEDAIADPHQPDEVILAPYHPDLPGVRKDYALYYDEITRLDFFVGQILDQLDRGGLSDNTFVLFISDNGKPFPRDKTSLYDSGIRSPWIVRWPDGCKPGTVCHQLVSSVDIAPTFLDLAGADVPDSLAGISFLPLLKTPQQSLREYIFAEKNWHDYEDHARAVRDRRYKLIVNSYTDLPNTPPADAVRSPIYQSMLEMFQAGTIPDNQRQIFTVPRPAIELYDTVADPFELNNLAGNPETAMVEMRLHRQLNQWISDTGDYIPSLRTADEFDRRTGRPTSARVRPRWSRARMVEAGLAAP